jgi:hypothetical protein
MYPHIDDQHQYIINARDRHSPENFTLIPMAQTVWDDAILALLPENVQKDVAKLDSQSQKCTRVLEYVLSDKTLRTCEKYVYYSPLREIESKLDEVNYAATDAEWAESINDIYREYAKLYPEAVPILKERAQRESDIRTNLVLAPDWERNFLPSCIDVTNLIPYGALTSKPDIFTRIYNKYRTFNQKKHHCCVTDKYCTVADHLAYYRHTRERHSEPVPDAHICWFHEIEKRRLPLKDFIDGFISVAKPYVRTCYDENNHKFVFPIQDVELVRKLNVGFIPPQELQKSVYPYIKLQKTSLALTHVFVTAVKTGFQKAAKYAGPALAILSVWTGIVISAVVFQTIRDEYNAAKEERTFEPQVSDGPKAVHHPRRQHNRKAQITQRVSFDANADGQPIVVDAIPQDQFVANMCTDRSGVIDRVLTDTLPLYLNQMCYVSIKGKIGLHDAFFVNCHTFILTHHALELLARDDILVFDFPLKGTGYDNMTVRFGDCTYVQMQSSLVAQKPIDLILVRLPPQKFVPGMQDMYSRFMPTNYLNNLSKNNYVAVTVESYPNLAHKIPHIRSVCDGLLMRSEHSYMLDSSQEDSRVITLPEYIIYPFPASKGKCVTLVLLVDPKYQSKARIAGFHVSGNVPLQKGVAAIVSSESIQDARTRLDSASYDKYGKVVSLEFEAEYSGGYVGDVVLSLPNKDPVLYTTTKPVDLPMVGGKITTYQPDTSKIVLSPIGVEQRAECTKAPAVLKPKLINGVWVDPFKKALSKLIRPIPDIKQEIVDLCVQDIKNLYNSMPSRVPRRLLTIEESAFGVPDMGIPSLNIKTSSGVKYKIEIPGLVGKKGLIDIENQTIAPRLRDLVHKRLELAHKGVILEALCEDLLKDEKRPLEKVAECKTRLFNSNPLDLTMAIRMYFGAFMSEQMMNRIYCGSAVGINPVSSEWDLLAKYLLKFGDHIVAGDFSNYDASLPREFLFSYLDAINDWYDDSEENQYVRTVLWCTITAPLHLARGIIYWSYSSNPSGNAATVFINNGASMIAFRYAWYSILLRSVDENDEPYDVAQCPFNKYVTLAVFGDDNIFGVHPKFRKIFNQATITKELATIQFQYTDETKSQGVELTFRPLNDCMFLKRHFTYDEANCSYIGRLDFTTLKEIARWTYTDIKHDELAQAIEQVIAEFALYPPHIFKTETAQLLRAARRNDYPIIHVSTYSAYRARAFETELDPDVSQIL